MKQSITDYPRINSGIQQQEDWLKALHLTAASLAETLSQPEYAAIPAVVPTERHWNSVQATVEKTTGFGMSLGNAFEEQSAQLGRIPTQAEFDDYCMPTAKQFWLDSKAQELGWSSLVATAISNRNKRTWISQVAELHVALLIQELFPKWKVFRSDDLDLLLGVDIVVETNKKRLYFHVLKNSTYSYAAFRKKEKRGGTKDAKGKFHKFQRNFSGDKVLAYSSQRDISSECTEYLNGIPLFKAEWLHTQLLFFNKFAQIGEPLGSSNKLAYLENFLDNLNKQEVAG